MSRLRERMWKDMAYRLERPQFIRTWAKCEIFLGLAAVAFGLLFGSHLVARPIAEFEWTLTAASLALIVLGGYLALAGQRSHLYQSSFEQTAFLLEEIRSQQIAKDIPSHEHPR